ncbi:hypothetical protein OAD58_01840 [Gammaproteobacteria bacterium]|nr:hypothetical protein [Gammaproteobacteria bacterium]
MDIFAAYAFYVSSKEFIKQSYAKTKSYSNKVPGYSPLKQSAIPSQDFQPENSSELSENNISEFKNSLSDVIHPEIQNLIDGLDAAERKNSSHNKVNYKDGAQNKKKYDPGLNFKTIKPKGMQGSLNFSDPNNSTSKLDDSVRYFFAYSLYLLKTEVNGLKLSESKKFDFRSKYIVDNKIKNHGVWFFSRIELESSKFTNYHVSSKTTDKIFKGDDMIKSEIRSYLKTII